MTEMMKANSHRTKAPDYESKKEQAWRKWMDNDSETWLAERRKAFTEKHGEDDWEMKSDELLREFRVSWEEEYETQHAYDHED